MNLAERLKDLRKQAGLSQEKLAEKLGVSRQAVTKWETEGGTPDIGNLMAVAALFGISLDELVAGEAPRAKNGGFLFESVTEYDIDAPKRYDMKCGNAKRVAVCGYEGEKIRVLLGSDRLQDLQSNFKVKIDDIRDRLDLEILRKNGVTAAAAKEGLTVTVFLPAAYIRHVELAANAESMEFTSLTCDQIEADVKTSSVVLEDVNSTVEINCDLDMQIECRSMNGSLELNQVSAASRVTLPSGVSFETVVKGLGNSVIYEKNGVSCADLSVAGAGNRIMLNGIRSELTIAVVDRKD